MNIKLKQHKLLVEINTSSSTNLIISNIINELIVTSIGAGAFYENQFSGILIIVQNVKTVEDNPFYVAQFTKLDNKNTLRKEVFKMCIIDLHLKDKNSL